MRISQEKKRETHRNIVEAAVHVIAAVGFREATMREIAERAGVGDATIYKYFPTKESLLFAFFELRMDDLVERLQGVPDFHRYTFREQFHLLLETKLELFAADRAFIRIAYNTVFLTNWIAAATAAKGVKERFIAIITELVAAAAEAGEFAEPPFMGLLGELLWEYTVAVTWYWLEDDSRKFAGTTQMIDRSLAVLDALLKGNVLNRIVELGQFLVREHLLGRINRAERDQPTGPPRPKRPFGTPAQPAGARAKRRRTAPRPAGQPSS